MRLSRFFRSTAGSMTAGQFDAGFTALSGFIAGLAAVRLLDAETLGAYAILFASFGVASQFATQLVFAPTEVVALGVPGTQRLAHLSASVGRGSVLAVVAAFLVGFGSLPVSGEVSSDALQLLTITAIAMTAVSPIQDHLRRMFHLADRSWLAAVVALVQFLTTIVAVLVLSRFDAALVPFGTAFASNTVSTAFGFVIAAPWRRGTVKAPGWRELGDIGRWLTVIGVATAAGRYVATAVVGWIAGSAALGFYQGARIVARPAEVVATGLFAVTNPRSMTASASGDVTRARRVRRLAVGIMAVTLAGYMLVALSPESINPFRRLAPIAYEVPGLISAVLVSFFVASIPTPYFAELMGVRLQSRLARHEIATQLVAMTASSSAALLGPFGMPFSATAASTFKSFAYRRTIERHYASLPAAGGPP